MFELMYRSRQIGGRSAATPGAGDGEKKAGGG